MAQTTAGHQTHAGHEQAPQAFIWRYVFSKDHKVIGIQYYMTAMVMAWVAGLLAMLIRLQLAWPEKTWPVLGRFLKAGFSDGVMNPEFYAMLFTMHGTIMVFFVLSTAPVSGFGNFLIPLQCGARDMAFPFLNALSYWTFLPGCLVILSSFFIGAGFFPKVFGEGGAAAGGWTSYPPLSALRNAIPGSQMGQSFWIVGMVLFIASFTMGGLNFLTTILNLRTKGLSLFRMPLTMWSMLLVAILGLLAFPALTAASLMLLLDRHFGTSFFLPAGLVVSGQALLGPDGAPLHQGGSPLLSRIVLPTPLVWALAVGSLFIRGGLSGILLGQSAVDIPLHDTYFVVAHFHLIMAGAALFGVFGATSYWFPKMFGRMMNETLGKLHFWFTFVAYYCVFFPMHYTGLAGHMRRIYDPYQYTFLKELQPVNQFITISAFVLGTSQLLFLVNLLWSVFKGPKAPPNPWNANGLEWTTPSPPGHGNWPGAIPEVYRSPYDYAVPGVAADHVMQTDPAPVGERAPHHDH